MVMAGGRGKRLHPLTRDRAKPAVPFGGKYRIIDFVLSNFINSGIYSLYVLTQFKAQSLVEHLQEGWQVGSILRDYFVTPVPAQMRSGVDWYRGTADACYQNIHLIKRPNPKAVAVFGADHVYKMNIRQMAERHWQKNAEVSIAALPVRIEEASQFGVMEVDSEWRILGFEEKPANPKPIPGEPEWSLVSMGNYVFDTKLLLQALESDSGKSQSNHDFGIDIIPELVKAERKIFAYDFRANRIPNVAKGEEASYWRDIGTVDAFFEANMELREVNPSLNLYNRSWPIRTVSYSDPPAKFVFDEDGRRGMALNSVVAEGTIITGSTVRDSVIGRNVFIHSYSTIEDAIIMNRVEIGRGCRLRRVILDKNVYIPPGTEIGYDSAKDRERYFVTKSGITVIPREEPRPIIP
ncbi:MAG TPA: glucose-1-phosphate adenylyltransferase [Candidatus Binatia bacterium]